MRKTDGIIKHCKKFKVAKVPKGMDLKCFKTSPRKKGSPYTSTSINKFGGVWFNLADGKAIFKTFDSDYNAELRELRMANELICQALADQVGVNHAKYEPASFGRDNGLVSYNVVGNRQRLVCLQDFISIDRNYTNNLVDVLSAVEDYKRRGYRLQNYDKSQFAMDLYKMLVFDALTMQTDRHNFNINFLFDDYKREFCVAPIFDNEYAFNIEQIIDFYTVEPNMDFARLATMYSEESKYFNVQHERYGDTRAYDHNIANLTDLAKSDRQMAKFMKICLTKMNVESAINTVEKLGYRISKPYKKYIIQIVENTKNMFAKELRKPKSDHTNDLYEDFIK